MKAPNTKIQRVWEIGTIGFLIGMVGAVRCGLILGNLEMFLSIQDGQ